MLKCWDLSVNPPFGQQEMASFFSQCTSVISAFTKKLFKPMSNDFYYTSTEHTCLHLQNVLYFEENNISVIAHCSFSQNTIRSIGMPPPSCCFG